MSNDEFFNEIEQMVGQLNETKAAREKMLAENATLYRDCLPVIEGIFARYRDKLRSWKVNVDGQEGDASISLKLSYGNGVNVSYTASKTEDGLISVDVRPSSYIEGARFDMISNVVFSRESWNADELEQGLQRVVRLFMGGAPFNDGL